MTLHEQTEKLRHGLRVQPKKTDKHIHLSLLWSGKRSQRFFLAGSSITPTPNTFSLNTDPFEKRGNGPRLYPMTGRQMNLFAFSSTPLNL